jgi:adenine/guanine phosphoribosyltransferase-like PRPP-binding protein
MADGILNKIDEILATTPKNEVPGIVFDEIMEHYDNNEIFRKAIDILIEYIESHFEVKLIDYVSGGEKRNWLFSMIIANFLGKPHITIYKDLSTVVSTCDFEESTEVTALPGKRVFHITDILNSGSNFKKAWVPAINHLGSKINWALCIVDRNQSGDKNLEKIGVRPYKLVEINKNLFDLALSKCIINPFQFDMLSQYFDDPDGTMRLFINEHPGFIDDVINNSTDEMAVKSAMLCKEKNWYGNPLGD